MIRRQLVNFEKMELLYKPVGYGFPVSSWDLKIIKSYYKLRSGISKVDNFDLKVDVMPLNVWLLHKYIFECIFLLISVIGFVFYIKYVPVYKGYISFYVAFIILLYGILSIRIIGFYRNVSRGISTLKSALKRDIN